MIVFFLSFARLLFLPPCVCGSVLFLLTSFKKGELVFFYLGTDVEVIFLGSLLSFLAWKEKQNM
jgi:hypothetical protein